MILEKETYEKFGYYPSDLKPKSHKRILAACDDCGKVRLIPKQAYRSLCFSCAKKGTGNPFFGKYHSKDGKKKISKSRKGKYIGKNNPNWKGGKIKRICSYCKVKIFYVDPYLVKNGYGKYCSHSCSRKATKMPKHHTKPEMIFEEICKKNNLPLKYVGDGNFWIGKLNPDFIECNGKRIVVEIFGDYWHSPLLRYDIKKERTLIYRKKYYKKRKWASVFIWESDLLRKDAEQFVLLQLSKY